MQLKANLHLHTSDDPHDLVTYSLYEAVDAAAKHDFHVLAITCHGRAAWNPDYHAYAAERGILLLRGIEANIAEHSGERGRHVLLLGVDETAEAIETFADLEQYQATHPHMLTIAPHPFMDSWISLQQYALKYIHLFDAIEHSWFYSRRINRNQRALELAATHDKPIVATSDTHFLNYLDDHYTFIETSEQTEAAVIAAVKAGAVTIQTRPHRFWREMIIPQARFTIRTILWRRGWYKPKR